MLLSRLFEACRRSQRHRVIADDPHLRFSVSYREVGRVGARHLMIPAKKLIEAAPVTRSRRRACAMGMKEARLVSDDASAPAAASTGEDLEIRLEISLSDTSERQ
jgi:hypothetical protein